MIGPTKDEPTAPRTEGMIAPTSEEMIAPTIEEPSTPAPDSPEKELMKKELLENLYEELEGDSVTKRLTYIIEAAEKKYGLKMKVGKTREEVLENLRKFHEDMCRRMKEKIDTDFQSGDHEKRMIERMNAETRMNAEPKMSKSKKKRMRKKRNASASI
jgi:hypothetical protein